MKNFGQNILPNKVTILDSLTKTLEDFEGKSNQFDNEIIENDLISRNQIRRRVDYCFRKLSTYVYGIGLKDTSTQPPLGNSDLYFY